MGNNSFLDLISEFFHKGLIYFVRYMAFLYVILRVMIVVWKDDLYDVGVDIWVNFATQFIAFFRLLMQELYLIGNTIEQSCWFGFNDYLSRDLLMRFVMFWVYFVWSGSSVIIIRILWRGGYIFYILFRVVVLSKRLCFAQGYLSI